MNKRLLFHTGLFMEESTRNYPAPPFKGRGWHIEYHNHKDKCRFNIQKEVTIFASNRLTAQKTLNLIMNCLELYNGQPTTPFRDFSLIAFSEEDREFTTSEEFKNNQFSSLRTFGIPLACFLAAKVCQKKKYIYALAKYNFSVTLYSEYGVDLEPWSAPHLPISQHPEDHIVFCHAIIAAYSVLEELGLEVRASHKNPRIIKGEWNPKVQKDLKKRLETAGVNLSEKFLWAIRGPKRKLEAKNQIPIIEKMNWSSGPVKDAKVDILEAIAYASWLRSKVSSHKTKDITASISPYDVNNTQSLARRLFLESLGLWREHFIQPKE
jgi:hypothetical protein